MAVKSIRVVPDPVLREKASPIKQIDRSTVKLIDDMVETLRSAGGVGLAAPQVGILLRVIVIEIPKAGLFIMINPEIIKRSGQRTVTEGCLSIPGYEADIKRSGSVIARAFDIRGKEFSLKAKDLLSHALEHEIDHLDGVLYIDYLESVDKLRSLETQEPAEK